MFKRRRERGTGEKVREWVWPRSGWRRMVLYYRHRLARLPDTPYRIAAGFACGAAVSFTPFILFHILISLAIAFILRANLVAAAIGTLVGNPWTFPFIWLMIYQLGVWIIGAETDQAFTELLRTRDVWNDLTPVLWPMTVGGIPSAFVVWWLFYWPIRKVIEKYRRRRLRQLERRMMKVHDQQ